MAFENLMKYAGLIKKQAGDPMPIPGVDPMAIPEAGAAPADPNAAAAPAQSNQGPVRKVKIEVTEPVDPSQANPAPVDMQSMLDGAGVTQGAAQLPPDAGMPKMANLRESPAMKAAVALAKVAMLKRIYVNK